MKILLVAVLIAIISAGDAAPAETEVKVEEAQFPLWPGGFGGMGGMGMNGMGGFPGFNSWNMDQNYNVQPMKKEEFPVDYSQSCSNSCRCVQICVRWVPCDCSCPPPCPPATTTTTTTTTKEPTTTTKLETTTPVVVEPDTTPGDCPTCCRPCQPCMPCMIWWMCRPCNPCNNGCETTLPDVGTDPPTTPPTPPTTTEYITTTTSTTTTTTTPAPCVPCRPRCPPCMIWWMCSPCVRNPCSNGCEEQEAPEEETPDKWDQPKNKWDQPKNQYPEPKYPEMNDWNKNYYRQF